MTDRAKKAGGYSAGLSVSFKRRKALDGFLQLLGGAEGNLLGVVNIEGFAGGDGRPEGDLYAALARLYERIGKDFAGPKTEIDVLRAFFSE